MKFAIAGAGAIGATHAGSILDNPRADLAAVCDVNPGAAKRLAEPQNAAVVTELDELLALAPDSLIVASSTASHGDVALATICAGIPFLGQKLARWNCSEDPSEVFEIGSVLIDPGYRQVGEVDTAKILLRMPSGTLCQHDFSWRAAYGQDERIEVNGAGGMICTIQEPTGPVVHQTADGLVHPGKLPGWQERFASTYRAELDTFIDLVDGGDSNGVLAGLQDGVAAQRIAEACK